MSDIIQIKLLNSDKIAIIDRVNLPLIADHKWKLHSAGYVFYWFYIKRRQKDGAVFLHDLILPNDNPELEVDHIDRNKLNNCLSNLRLVTRAQNRYNLPKRFSSKSIYNGASSIYKGVSWHKRYKVWRARGKLNKKEIFLGIFKSEREAAIAYNNFAKENYGEFAVLNIIEQ